MLGGYKTNEWSYVGLSNLIWGLKIYFTGLNDSFYDPNRYPILASRLVGGHDINYPRNFIYDPTTDAINNNKLWYLTEGIFTRMMMKGHSSLRQPYALRTNPASSNPPNATPTFDLPVGNEPKARPNTYLVNICSNKTDVFEPFDKQQLVWTGYYKSLLGVDTITGVDTDGNYYYGDNSLQSVSGDVYGGDTYICKYSYRTTSNLYGVARFNKGVNKFNVFDQQVEGLKQPTAYIWGDIPLDSNLGKTPSYLTNIFGTAEDYNVLWWGGTADNSGTEPIEGAGNEFGGARRSAISLGANWSTQGYEVFTTVYQYMVETDDNINYRHAGDPEKGVSELNSMFFDKYVAADVLYRSPLGDLTKMDNLLYEDHYSALQDYSHLKQHVGSDLNLSKHCQFQSSL
jgi:hypothetical protein